MPSINNDQNIERRFPKMSEGFHDENNANLSKCIKTVALFEELNEIEENLSDEDINVIDHMYSSNDDNEEQNVNTPSLSCQTAESEVKLIKDWLILHTDLIQQQNDDIIDRDREIYILRKENEMLKKQIYCLENGIPYQLYRVCSPKVTEDSQEVISEDMTQSPSEEDSKDNIEYIAEPLCETENIALDVTNYSENNLNLSDNESQLDSEVIEDDNNYSIRNHHSELELKSEEIVYNDIGETFVSESESDLFNCNSFSEYNFTIDNIVSEIDPMKNLRMSIRRKRVCSGSSALSSKELVADVENKEHLQELKKKKRLPKDSQILTFAEPYVTQANDVTLSIVNKDPELSVSNLTNLEVPRWRHKVYASCYSMEGTENLDDEVFNKRHMRLEIDERRRKRWDVQRIREQRVIEKLKLRHEKAACSKGDAPNPLPSLWPKLEDVKYLEISEELPVSAFGNPIPKISPSEFSLPWLGNPTLLAPKKSHTRRSTVRKKSKR